MLKGCTFNHVGELRVKDSFAQDWSPYKLASKKRSWLPAKLCKNSYPIFKAITSIHPEGLELRHLIMPGERPVLPATTNTKPAGLGWSQGSDIYVYCTLAPDHSRGGANALLIRWLKNPTVQEPCKKVYVLPRNVKWQSRNYTSASAAISVPPGLQLQSLCWESSFSLFIRPFQSDLYIFHFIYLFTCFIFLGGRDLFHSSKNIYEAPTLS